MGATAAGLLDPGQKCISLETFRRSGAAVRTPVWFVEAPGGGGRIYVVTRRSTGKVGRLAANPAVRVAPCTARGRITGGWIGGEASEVAGAEAEEAARLRRKKYGLMAALARLASAPKGEPVAYLVRLGGPPGARRG